MDTLALGMAVEVLSPLVSSALHCWAMEIPQETPIGEVHIAKTRSVVRFIIRGRDNGLEDQNRVSPDVLVDELRRMDPQHRFRQSPGKSELEVKRMAHHALIDPNQVVERLRVLGALRHLEDKLGSGLHAVSEAGENPFQCPICHFRRIFIRNTVVEEGGDLLERVF